MAFRRSPVRSRSGPPNLRSPAASFGRQAKRVPSRRRMSTVAAEQRRWTLQRTSSFHPRARRIRRPRLANASQIPQHRCGRLPTSSLILSVRCWPQPCLRALNVRQQAHRLRAQECGPSSSLLHRPDVEPQATAGGAQCQPLPHTASGRPWNVDVVVKFADEPRAVAFERYLKSGSGSAFAGEALALEPQVSRFRCNPERESSHVDVSGCTTASPRVERRCGALSFSRSPHGYGSGALSAHHLPSPQPGAFTCPSEVVVEPSVPDIMSPSAPANEKPPFARTMWLAWSPVCRTIG